MTLSQYTGSLRGVTFGVGEEYLWGTDAPSGLGIPTPETTDITSAGDGSIGGADRLRNRIIRVPMIIATDDGGAEDDLDYLKRAWRPSASTVELDLRLSGEARRYYGRPRGLEVDVTRIEQGFITAAGTFDALDPYAYDTTLTSVTTDSSSPVTVENAGTAASNRATLTIVGNGGKPQLTNAADPFGGIIKFRLPLGFGQSVTVDLRTFHVINSSGAHVEHLLSVESSFFAIEVGSNPITFTGCASVAATVRPAYY
jgi:hypothetical protein